jgi:hypothetical protein
MEEEIEEEVEEDVKSDDIFYRDSEENNFFYIGFEKIFDRPEIAAYDGFEMNSKRNFKNLTPDIIRTYNELFLDEGKFNSDLAIIIFQILSAKSKLVTSQTPISYEDFIKMLDEICAVGDNCLLNVIDGYVNENYVPKLDAITAETKAKNKKVNQELQFSDKHALILLKIAYLYRVLIPIISVYFTFNKDSFLNGKAYEPSETEEDDMAFEDVNEEIFAHLFEKFAKNPTALKNKLYHLVYSRVAKTSYSDQRFWKKAKDLLITKENVSLEIYKKLLTNAIPKLLISEELNIISFFQSVINNQVDFLFKNKFKFVVQTIGRPSDDSDGGKFGSDDDDDDDESSEFEKTEKSMLRRDEGEFLIRKLSVNKLFEGLPKVLNVTLTDEEVSKFLATFSRNEIQEKIVSMTVLKYLDDPDALKFLTFYQYGKLVLMCSRYLSDHGFLYLPKILLAKCERHKERIEISGKTIKPLIRDSKKYNELFDDKYREFSDEMKKPIEGLIGTAYSSVFKDNDGNEIFDSSVKVAKIADEAIDLAMMA